MADYTTHPQMIMIKSFLIENKINLSAFYQKFKLSPNLDKCNKWFVCPFEQRNKLKLTKTSINLLNAYNELTTPLGMIDMRLYEIQHHFNKAIKCTKPRTRLKKLKFSYIEISELMLN